MKKIAVVMGGPSTEREVSLRSGAAIYKALQEKGFNVMPLELNPSTFIQDLKDNQIDFVYNTVHGKFGEDGILQGTLDMIGIGYTGSDVLASSLTWDKSICKNIFVAKNIPTPRYAIYHRFDYKTRDLYQEILEEFTLPIVVKAPKSGSSIGVFIVEDGKSLETSLSEVFKLDDKVLIEEFIRGREFTVPVWDVAGQVETMPIIEITTTTGRYDYDTKYTKGASSHIFNSAPKEMADRINKIAILVYKTLDLRGLARIDFMVSWSGVVNVIEVNTAPGMTETSLVPDAAKAMGISFEDLCAKIVTSCGIE